jgi:hypothetical protein
MATARLLLVYYLCPSLFERQEVIIYRINTSVVVIFHFGTAICVVIVAVLMYNCIFVICLREELTVLFFSNTLNPCSLATPNETFFFLVNRLVSEQSGELLLCIFLLLQFSIYYVYETID